MNLRQLHYPECPPELKLVEQTQAVTLNLADVSADKKRIISVQVYTAGDGVARVSAASGTIPSFAFSILDRYMLEHGFKKYHWERERADGSIKTVIRRIKVKTCL